MNKFIPYTSHEYDFTHSWHKFVIRDMTDLYVTCHIHKWHDSFVCDMPHSYVTCLIHMWHASFVCDMPHSYVTCLIRIRHDSFICDMPHSYVTCLIHRPTQSIMYVPFQVNRFHKSILVIEQYKYLKSCSEDFILKNLILRTRSCGTAFITQHGWLLHFCEICLVEHLGGASP